MHAIEEFFSEWIWKWDFDRLDIMCFSAVFNGVPVQPVLRQNYLRVNELDEAIKEKFDQNINHLFVINLQDNGGLAYRSPSLHIKDICALRKYVLKKVEKQVQLEKRKLDIESTNQTKNSSKVSGGLKSFTKSISTSHFLSYFSSSGSKSTETVSSTGSTSPTPTASVDSNLGLPAASDIPTAPSSSINAAEQHGLFLTGLIESTAIGMNGEERPVTKSDFVRVYISSTPLGDLQPDTLVEYYLVVYKHHKSNLVWSFLLPATSQSQDLISDPLFYTRLESYMSTEKKLDELTQVLLTDMKSMQEKSLQLGKHYKCFYYDNATLNIRSTMMDQPLTKDKSSTAIQVTNDMLLQLLEVKEDFENIPKRTSEVYTRSTANHWIAGHRLYNTLKATEEEEQGIRAEQDQDSSRSSIDHNDKKEGEDYDNDYTEMYLIAAKKDTSLADVEGKSALNRVDQSCRKRLIYINISIETLGKMTKSLLDAMHIE
jgi:hypothetical protein